MTFIPVQLVGTDEDRACFLDWTTTVSIRQDLVDPATQSYVGVQTFDAFDTPLHVLEETDAIATMLGDAAGFEIPEQPTAPFGVFVIVDESDEVVAAIYLNSRLVAWVRSDPSSTVGVNERSLVAMTNGEGPYRIQGTPSAVVAQLEALQGTGGGSDGSVEPLWQYIQGQSVEFSFDPNNVIIGSLFADDAVSDADASVPGGTRADFSADIGAFGMTFWRAEGTEARPLPSTLPSRFVFEATLEWQQGEASGQWLGGLWFGRVTGEAEIVGWVAALRVGVGDGALTGQLECFQVNGTSLDSLGRAFGYNAYDLTNLVGKIRVEVLLQNSGDGLDPPRMQMTAHLDSLLQGSVPVSIGSATGVTVTTGFLDSPSWDEANVNTFGVFIGAQEVTDANVHLVVSDCSVWPRIGGGDWGGEA